MSSNPQQAYQQALQQAALNDPAQLNAYQRVPASRGVARGAILGLNALLPGVADLAMPWVQKWNQEDLQNYQQGLRDRQNYMLQAAEDEAINFRNARQVGQRFANPKLADQLGQSGMGGYLDQAEFKDYSQSGGQAELINRRLAALKTGETPEIGGVYGVSIQDVNTVLDPYQKRLFEITDAQKTQNLLPGSYQSGTQGGGPVFVPGTIGGQPVGGKPLGVFTGQQTQPQALTGGVSADNVQLPNIYTPVVNTKDMLEGTKLGLERLKQQEDDRRKAQAAQLQAQVAARGWQSLNNQQRQFMMKYEQDQRQFNEQQTLRQQQAQQQQQQNLFKQAQDWGILTPSGAGKPGAINPPTPPKGNSQQEWAQYQAKQNLYKQLIGVPTYTGSSQYPMPQVAPMAPLSYQPGLASQILNRNKGR